MQLPVIAIVGRPNVGKSTLLNALAGRRVSVVDPTEGVTRDRVSVILEHGDRVFELMDTGGIGIVDVQDLSELVEQQITVALETADVIVFLVDARAGLTPYDETIAKQLHELGKPLVLGANKAESRSVQESATEFRKLGFGKAIRLSAQNRENTLTLLDAAVALLPEGGPTEKPDPHLKVAIVGRRNSGKSTLVNSIARADRVIVSEKPGTTRDAVDVWVERDKETWILIDTAGVVQRGADGKDPIQWYSQNRAMKAIRRADVVILLLDVTREVGRQEKKLGRAIADAGKPCLLVGNKWDLVDGVRTGKFEEYFDQVLPGLRRAPVAFISALERMNVQRTLDVCTDLYRQANTWLPTGPLNRFVVDSLEHRKPRIKSSRVPKVYYVTQVGVAPPTIALYVNDPKLFDPSFRRYLENRFRDTFDFPEVPVRLDFRPRERKSLSALKAGD